MSEVLTVKKMCLSVPEKTVCQNLNWQVDAGQIWGILGQNGVGKSTLLHAVSGMREMDSGQIFLQGKAMEKMKRRDISRLLGFLFQHQDDIFPTSVFEQVMMGRHPHISFLQGEASDDLKQVQKAINEMGLAGMEYRRIDTLSGGERRRVAIAAILAQQPQLYLLDEPEAHLDPSHQKAIFSKLLSVVEQWHKSLVMAIHDINLAIHYCTHLLMLFGDGEIQQGAVAEIATQANVERLYGTQMIQFEKEGRVAFLVR